MFWYPALLFLMKKMTRQTSTRHKMMPAATLPPSVVGWIGPGFGFGELVVVVVLDVVVSFGVQCQTGHWRWSMYIWEQFLKSDKFFSKCVIIIKMLISKFMSIIFAQNTTFYIYRRSQNRWQVTSFTPLKKTKQVSLY